jgi:hypothetical protein
MFSTLELTRAMKQALPLHAKIGYDRRGSGVRTKAG